MAGRRRQLLRDLAIPALAALLSFTAMPAAQALVPYVYIPRSQELEGAGLGIAQAANRLLRLGQAEDAARLAELTVRLLPQDPRGWLLLAEAELRSNHNSKALVALTRAKELDPRNPGIWFAEGSLALRRGQPQEALGLLQQGLKLDGKNSGAYFDLGNAYLLLHRPGDALSAFERASGLRGDFWEAINNQGLVLFEQGQRGAAISRWRRVLSIKADVAETSLALAAGLFVSESGQRAEAVRLAEKALAKDPNYVLDSHQKEQLWGVKMRAAARQLLAQPELKTAVERAQANATPGAEAEDDG